MKAFVLTADNHITAYASRAWAQASLSEGAVLFASAAELAEGSANWPSARLLQIWNSIPGLAPVRKFTDRKTGLARIWKAIQNWEPAPDAAPSQAPAADSRPRPAKRAQAKAPSGSEGSKRAEVIALMRRSGSVSRKSPRARELPGLRGDHRSMNVRREEPKEWTLETPACLIRSPRTCAASALLAVAPARGIFVCARPLQRRLPPRSASRARRLPPRPFGASMRCALGWSGWSVAYHIEDPDGSWLSAGALGSYSEAASTPGCC